MKIEMGGVALMVMVIILLASTEDVEGQSCTSDSLNFYCQSYLDSGTYFTNCCSLVSTSMNYDRQCYCLSNQTSQILTLCDIPETRDSICPTQSPATPATSAPPATSASKMPIIIGISVGLVAVLISSIACFICIRRKRRLKQDVENHARSVLNVADDPQHGNSSEPNVANDSQHGDKSGKLIPTENIVITDKESSVTPEAVQYELADLEAATKNFSKENQIGRGGFGIVYKGTLSNGQEIAVKRLSQGSGQGDKEFQTEIALLAKFQHTNLVRLLGFGKADDEALLVYEFVANKSLDYFLFDSKKRVELNWLRRFEIIKGIARGMVYLHEDSPMRTMHRDLKAGNVLLDAEMHPKIADFGLARICDIEQTHINPTQVVGTRGYMAPEYLFHGKFSAKSDVYSLGVLILEIVSGTRVGGSSVDQTVGEGLISYTWRCWEDETPIKIVDPLLKDSNSMDEVLQCVQLGLLCVQEDPNLRPRMSTMVRVLDSSSRGLTLPTPQHPAYIYSGGSQNTTTITNTTGSGS